jgi:hypothetical protein
VAPPDGRRPRHRIPEQRRAEAPRPDLPPHDPELDSYLAALTPERAPGATEVTGRFGSAQVFVLRLPALRIEQLRRLAGERGVSPGALAVSWVLERLDQEDTVTGPLPVDLDVESPARRGTLRRPGRR